MACRVSTCRLRSCAARESAADVTQRLDVAATLDVLARVGGPRGSSCRGPGVGALFGELRRLMWDKVGPFRNEGELNVALARIESMRCVDLHRIAQPAPGPYAQELVDWHELRAALDVARAVTTAALRRPESRGAHQRDDHPGLQDAFAHNQTLRLEGDEIVSTFGAGDLCGDTRWAM